MWRHAHKIRQRMVTDLCDLANILDKIVLSKQLEIAFQSTMKLALLWFVGDWKISPFCIFKSLDSLISFDDFHKEGVLKGVNFSWFNLFASCMDGWL